MTRLYANLPRTASVRALTQVNAIEIPATQLKGDDGSGYWANLFTKALAERFIEKEREHRAMEERLKRARLSERDRSE